MLSMFGSYTLIRQTLNDFDEGCISLVVENLQKNDITYFPSIGVCEIGHLKEVYKELEMVVQTLVGNINCFMFSFIFIVM